MLSTYITRQIAGSKLSPFSLWYVKHTSLQDYIAEVFHPLNSTLSNCAELGTHIHSADGMSPAFCAVRRHMTSPSPLIRTPYIAG
jgi:hypothetical protein